MNNPKTLWRTNTHLGRSIDYGHKFSEVAAEQLVEEDRVLLLEALQKGVFPQSCVSGCELIIRTLTLLVKCVDLVWETTDETKLLALINCERSAFVPVRVCENSVSSKSDTRYPVGHGRSDQSCPDTTTPVPHGRFRKTYQPAISRVARPS